MLRKADKRININAVNIAKCVQNDSKTVLTHFAFKVDNLYTSTEKNRLKCLKIILRNTTQIYLHFAIFSIIFALFW